MNLIFHNYYESLNENNNLFHEKNTSIGDNLLVAFNHLASKAPLYNAAVSTSSIKPIEWADAFVFIDFPDIKNVNVKRIIGSDKPLYLIMLESELIRHLPSDPKISDKFRKIFTYDDRIIDGERFIKINYSFELGVNKPFDSLQKRKLITLVASNKNVRGINELYSKRLEAIKWFEKNHPAEFDFYGMGWGLYDFGIRLPWRLLNKFTFLRRCLAPTYITYRGSVERKNPVLSKYRFAICYENICNSPGYITEKIFDCFFAGCVPIYWGANNILDYIPADCFIDKTKFDTYEDLYCFITSMSDETYEQYLTNIRSFLGGPKASLFSVETFANTILQEISEDLKKREGCSEI